VATDDRGCEKNYKSNLITLNKLGASRDFALLTHSQSPESMQDKFSLSQINPRQGERLFNKTQKQLKNLGALSFALLFFIGASSKSSSSL